MQDISYTGPSEMDEHTERFSRERAAGYSREIIDRSDVVLAGCGALGQFVALVLALSGFPKITFIDMDIFEESNISRSPFFRLGWNKAKATALYAKQLCTATGSAVYAYSTDMVQRLGDAIFTRAPNTIVFAAVDNLAARFWLAQRCRLTGIPLVEGGFHAQRWNSSVFPNRNAKEPCWACDHAGERTSSRVFSCDAYARAAIRGGAIPATATGAMALAAHQVEAAIAMLHGDLTLASSTIFGHLRQGPSFVMKRIPNVDCALNHRIVVSEAVPLSTSPCDSVGQLLADVAQLVPAPIVGLPASFIRVAPCAQCRQPAVVEEPDWALEGPPVCGACGGRFERSTARVPEQHGMLSEPTSEDILNIPLSMLGLGPGLHVNVTGPKDRLTVRLAGNVTDFLTRADG